MLKQIIYSLFFYIIISCIGFIQLGCGGAGGTNNNSSPVTNDVSGVNPGISLGSVTTIPLLGSTTAFTEMLVSNNTASDLNFSSATIIQDGISRDATLHNNLLNLSNCKSIALNSTCSVIITPPNIPGGFVLHLTFVDSNGVKYSGAQVINYTNQIHQENGFVYFSPGSLPSGKSTLSIPVVLENNYVKLTTKLENFVTATSNIKCPYDNYQAGAMCTIFVSYTSQTGLTGTPTLIVSGELDTTSVSNNAVLASGLATNTLLIPLSISDNNAANLVVSAPNIQINGSLAATVTMLNNGANTATNISYNGLTPINATSSGGTCTTTLPVGSTCTFKVSVNSASTSGSGKVIILYSNGAGQIESSPFTVYYFPATTTPGLIISNNGWLVGSVVNKVSYQGVYIANSGTAMLDNLQFGSVSNQVASMGYGGTGQTCVIGQSLAPGAGCVLVVYYIPNAAQAFSLSTKVNVAATASYTDAGGHVVNYAGDSASVFYSSGAPTANLGNYVVAGDYGAITANLGAGAINGTTGWAVKNNTPFTVAGVTISRMANNGTLQVAGTGGAAGGAGVIYQAPYGMIWESVGGTNAPPVGSPISGLTYDSSNGYLVSNNANTNVYSTNLLNKNSTTWAVLAAFATSPAFNIFNFFNGSTWAYFAPQNTATTGQQLALSITPKTLWTVKNPSGTARAYIAAIYDGSRYCVLSTTRFISCANSAGFTTATAWTQNTTVISASTVTNMFANNGSSSYVALGSTAPFVVYLLSPSNPATAGTWTTAATQPSAALAWVTYGEGQYVAVSAATPGLVWTSPTGNIWTQRISGTANSPINEPYGFIDYDGSNYWASGTLVLRVSPDGINWTNAGIRSLTYFYNGTTLTFLAAGTAGAIESSANLTSWTGVTSTTTSQINQIRCFNSTNCFAVGQNGLILFSNDGAAANWNPQISGLNNALNSVACGYTNCVIVGESGVILTESIAATNWSSQIVGGGINNLNSVTFNTIYGIYIAVGDAGKIYTSSDGVKWDSKVSNTANNLYSVKCANSLIGCMAVGNVIGSATTGTVVTSLSGAVWVVQTATTGSNREVTFYNGNWVVVQTSTVGGTIRSTADVIPMVWTAAAKASGITNAAAINFNAILAY